MLSYHGVSTTYLHHSVECCHGANAVGEIQSIESFSLSVHFYADHRWNTQACSTVETRRHFLANCINQTMNSTEILLEKSTLYENCSQQLTNSRIVSPAQEYFQ
jgi:hypothetical protein